MIFNTITKSLIFGGCLVVESVFPMASSLKSWNSIDDVREFCLYVEKNGYNDFKVNQNIVEDTKKKLRGDIYKLLPIWVKAMYYVPVIPISAQASMAVVELVQSKTKVEIPCKHYLVIPDNMFEVKLAWLLWCSQTEQNKGKVLLENAEGFAVEIAKEILDRQVKDAKGIADTIYDLIDKAIK